MQTRAWRVAPRAAAPLPAGNHPALAGRVLARGERGGEYLVLVGSRVEAGEAREHHAHLHAKSAELFGATVGYAKLHPHAVLARCDEGRERDLVWQSAFECKRAIGLAGPLLRVECHLLLVPNRRDVCVAEVEQFGLVVWYKPDRFGNVGDRVAASRPGC